MNKQLTVNKLKKMELNEIRQRKLEVLNDIHLQKDVIVYSTQRIFSPFTSTNGESGSIIKKFNTSLLIFDGIMMGYKVIKNIKRVFKRR